MKKIFDDMTLKEKREYIATGKVTVGTISVVEDHSIKSFFVAKIRGRIVSMSEKYKFENAHDARMMGFAFRDYQRKMLHDEKGDK